MKFNALLTSATLSIAAAAMAISAPAAAAINLVSNPGFETNDGPGSDVFTDWVNNGHFAADSFYADMLGIGLFEGDYSASTGCVNMFCTMSQTIATQAGRSYTLSFAFNPGIGADPGEASTIVSFGGVDISPDIGVGPLGWNTYTYTVTGSGSDTLEFRSLQNPAYTGIDAVSLTANVPEPASWAMLIAGFGLTGAAMRRRRAVIAA